MGSGSSKGGEERSPWLLETHAEHQGSVNCMAVSEESGVIVTGSDDATLRLWTCASDPCMCIMELKGHHKYITSVAIEGPYVLSGSADKTIKKWDMGTGECLYSYTGHTGMVNRLLSVGTVFFTSSYDATARCWLLEERGSVEGEGCVRVFRGHSKGVYPMMFIPVDEEWQEEEPDLEDMLITGSGDGTARMWSVGTGRTLVTYRGHTGPVHALAVDSEGRILFTGSADGGIRSWEILTGQCLKEFNDHVQPITVLVVENRFLFSASADRTVKSWVIEFGDLARTYKGHKHSIACLIFHEGIIYTGCGDGNIRAFEAKSGVLKRLFKGHDFAINCIRIVDKKLFSGSFDNSMRIWKLNDIAEANHPLKPNKEKQAKQIILPDSRPTSKLEEDPNNNIEPCP